MHSLPRVWRNCNHGHRSLTLLVSRLDPILLLLFLRLYLSFLCFWSGSMQHSLCLSRISYYYYWRNTVIYLYPLVFAHLYCLDTAHIPPVCLSHLVHDFTTPEIICFGTHWTGAHSARPPVELLFTLRICFGKYMYWMRNDIDCSH